MPYARWFTLSSDLTILDTFPEAKAGLKDAIGQRLTDAFPDVPPELPACYRAAFRSGSSACLAEYPEGTLLSVYAVKRGDTVHVSFDSVRPADIKRLLLRWEARACEGCAAPPQRQTPTGRSAPLKLLPQVA